MRLWLSLALVLLGALGVSGCAGTIIDTTTDAAIAVAKTPFKVAGAAIDVVTPDGDD